MKQEKLRGRAPVIIACVIIILGVIGMLRRGGHDTDSIAMEYVKPGGDTLAVAIEMSPLTYSLHNDTAEGFDYQILRDITAEHGIVARFYPVADLEEAFRGLYSHNYDLLVGSLPTTATLKSHFPVTDAVYIDKQVLVQRRDTTGRRQLIRTQEQLLRDTVWVAEGSPYQTRLRNMSKELGESIFVITPPKYSSEHLAILTALGEVKQAVVNEAIARRIAEDYPELDVETPISFRQFQCWAVAPGDSALLDSLNTWLTQFKATEAYRKLTEKYL